MNPFDRLLDFNKRYPESREVYKRMQRWHLANSDGSNTFFPSGLIYNECPSLVTALMSGQIESAEYNAYDIKTKSLVEKFWGLFFFGAWRNTLGIYRMDADSCQQAMSASIPTDTPSNIFSRLPEWCVYIELPKNTVVLNIGGEQGQTYLEGFWAATDLRYIQGKQQSVLSLSLNTKDETGTSYDVLQPLDMVIKDGVSIEDAVLQAYGTYFVKDEESRLTETADVELNLIRACLSTLLWLCAEEPDITNIAGEPVSRDAMRLPKYGRNKKTGAFIPPNQPIIYDVGKRLGGEVRTFNEKYGKPDARISSRKRPHIRRGHWHGVWRGTGQNKSFHIYWQPAVFVNATI